MFKEDWDDPVIGLLDAKYLVTLDYDVKYLNGYLRVVTMKDTTLYHKLV